MPQPRRTPWYAVDVDVRKDERIADLPSDAARWGYVAGVLAEARLQTQGGVFGSRATLLEAIGRFGRHVPAYLSGGLLEEAPHLCAPCLRAFGPLRPGAIVVHNWVRKQNDPGHADRQELYRQRQRGADGDANVTGTGRDGDGDGDANPTAHSRARGVTYTDTDTRESSSISPPSTRPDRPDLLALVNLHHWRRVTRAQRTILDELAGYERSSEADVASGYAVVASWIRETPDDEDPLQYAIACGKGRRAERELASIQAEVEWRGRKERDRATAPERLGDILGRVNGAETQTQSATQPTPPAAQPPPPPAATARPRGASGG